MVGIDLITEVSTILKAHNIKTEIISASVRNPIHASECALAGSDIATIPFNVLKQMAKHPLTDIGIEKFLADYKNM
ncbi:Transaldolase [bioreactor metagenome]|uniref:Transaldolase n=1 Tax=bioreactor metagenome TaxID=1076179 RepID=A0A645DVL7_9ZZZZ